MKVKDRTALLFQNNNCFSFKISVPGGYIPRVETNERECWKFLDWRLASENESLFDGQPSFLLFFILILELARQLTADALFFTDFLINNIRFLGESLS